VNPAKTSRLQLAAAGLVTAALFGMLLFVACARQPFRRLPLRVRTGRLLAPPLVRVLLYQDARPLPIACEGRCVLVGRGLKDGSRTLESLPPTLVSAREGSLWLGETDTRSNVIVAMALGGGVLKVGPWAYRGSVRFQAGPDGTVTAVNIVDVETYLVGVLPGEMPSRWPLEALKAQAVAARTYALQRRKRNRGRPYHLVAGTADQVYRGWQKPINNIRPALEATRGIVMFHDDRLFTAYFHSTCGGHTADAARVLPAPDAAFIEGVPCPFCADSKYYVWRVRIGRLELGRLLRQAGYAPPPTFTVAVRRSGPEGTVENVILRGGRRRVTVSGEAFRRILGADRVKSRRFEVREEPDAVVIIGHGWGHGVGLCQYGARGAALAHWPYDAILAHYYGDVDLVQIYY